MISVDAWYAPGDSLPILTGVARGSDGQPVDLTGMVLVFMLRPYEQSGAAVNRTATADPDQVANKGKWTCKVFDAGTATPGFYAGRLKGTIGGEQISFRNDRPVIIGVSDNL